MSLGKKNNYNKVYKKHWYLITVENYTCYRKCRFASTHNTEREISAKESAIHRGTASKLSTNTVAQRKGKACCKPLTFGARLNRSHTVWQAGGLTAGSGGTGQAGGSEAPSQERLHPHRLPAGLTGYETGAFIFLLSSLTTCGPEAFSCNAASAPPKKKKATTF